MTNATFNFNDDFFKNNKAVILADATLGFYLQKLTQNIFSGLVGENKTDLLASLKICEKGMKKTFTELKEKEDILKNKYFSDIATGKLFLTIKTYITIQDEKLINIDDFLSLIDKKAFHYTSTKKPVEDYFNSLKSEKEKENEKQADDDNGKDEVKEKPTDFEKAKKLVNNIKNLDLSFDEIQVLCDMLKQC